MKQLLKSMLKLLWSYYVFLSKCNKMNWLVFINLLNNLFPRHQCTKISGIFLFSTQKNLSVPTLALIVRKQRKLSQNFQIKRLHSTPCKWKTRNIRIRHTDSNPDISNSHTSRYSVSRSQRIILYKCYKGTNEKSLGGLEGPVRKWQRFPADNDGRADVVTHEEAGAPPQLIPTAQFRPAVHPVPVGGHQWRRSGQ